MQPACPHCGNRQHAPGASVCSVCKTALSVAPQVGHTSAGQLAARKDSGFIDDSGRFYALNLLGESYIGSRGICGIVLSKTGVQPRHARIIFTTNGWQIEPVGGSSLLVNGQVLYRLGPLRAGDVVMLGSARLTFQTGTAAPTAHPAASTAIAPAGTAVTTQPPTPPSPATVPAQSPLGGCDLYGRVQHIDGPYMEEPDPTLARALAQTAGFLLALWRPAFLIFHDRNRQTPVRYIRVEETNGRMRAVKMKGHLIVGLVNCGDIVQFWGEWQNGTLLMFRGYNQTAATQIHLRQ